MSSAIYTPKKIGPHARTYKKEIEKRISDTLKTKGLDGTYRIRIDTTRTGVYVHIFDIAKNMEKAHFSIHDDGKENVSGCRIKPMHVRYSKDATHTETFNVTYTPKKTPEYTVIDGKRGVKKGGLERIMNGSPTVSVVDIVVESTIGKIDGVITPATKMRTKSRPVATGVAAPPSSVVSASARPSSVVSASARPSSVVSASATPVTLKKETPTLTTDTISRQLTFDDTVGGSIDVPIELKITISFINDFGKIEDINIVKNIYDLNISTKEILDNDYIDIEGEELDNVFNEIKAIVECYVDFVDYMNDILKYITISEIHEYMNFSDLKNTNVYTKPIFKNMVPHQEIIKPMVLAYGGEYKKYQKYVNKNGKILHK